MFNPMQMISGLQNPQQMLNQFLQKVPEGIRNDPNQIINWMQQNGMVTQDQIQRVQQMMNAFGKK